MFDYLLQEKRTKALTRSVSEALKLIKINDLFKFSAVHGLPANQLAELNTLGRIYFVYLFIYSGLEFTLTFLTHHTFEYNSMQQGWMFFTIGIIMAIIQGSIVRRLSDKYVGKAAVCGLWIIIPTFISIGFASPSMKILLYIGIVLFAVSTAFVVSCLTTIVSHYGRPEQKGIVMGIFRSLGSLARAVGPIFASISFWGVGSMTTYLTGAAALLWPAYMLHTMITLQNNKVK